jgi:outer membrane receptor protein involved in Fe transport
VLSRDFQVNQRTGLSAFTVVNADRVTSRGFELRAVASPARGLELTAATSGVGLASPARRIR